MTVPCETIEGMLDPLTAFGPCGDVAESCDVIEADAIPQPYRSLLAHDSDMTSTLERFHGGAVVLRPLETRRDRDAFLRRVLLVREADGRIVEFGAIRIVLERFDEAAQRQILESRQPLGAIIRDAGMACRCRPSGFFSIRPGAELRGLLGLDGAERLYGRRNVLMDDGERTLAEVVEVLPPQRDGVRRETETQT